MSLITFDICYKNKTEVCAFKLPSDSEYIQLKMMICGKYRIYDTNKVQIYYRQELLSCEDKTKLKDLFKFKRIKLDVLPEGEKLLSKANCQSQALPFTTSPLNQSKPLEDSSYVCKCKQPATYICDRCNEFLCEGCFKKKKHITHSNKVIKLSEYTNYIKEALRQTATELDDKITNDETYQFFSYWDYDMNNEIKNINQVYEFAKKQLEDMKQLQIDYIIALSRYEKFKELKSQIDDVIKDYASMDLSEPFEKIINKKRKILHDSKDILDKYENLKDNLIIYTNVVREIQQFNNDLTADMRKKFSAVKKKYYIPLPGTSSTQNPQSNIPPSENKTQPPSQNEPKAKAESGTVSPAQGSFKKVKYTLDSPSKDSPSKPKEKTEIAKSHAQLGQLNPSLQGNNSLIPQSKLNKSMNKINNGSSSNIKDKCIFKLKNDRRMIIFSTVSQTFKEKEFIDNSNFRGNITCEADITQLNLNGKLYLLTGNKYNKFYVYDYITNAINFISSTLYPHYFGSMIYCNKNNSIYLLGGNNQTKCEKYRLENNSRNDFEEVPSLCEERQEFGAMYYKDYIYVFFGFSPKKGVNLSSIERLNINNNQKFEIIYINEQITLSSLGCAVYIEEEEENKKENNSENDEILLLGGFDGKNYLDSSLVFNFREMKIRDCDIIIPNINKHSQFLFHKECTFLNLEGGSQIAFDVKNNVHLISKESYELFSEAPNDKK
ncbi:MAG: hypothetical protein MJ252_00990 [archaeon]|nr:hypothetical protein [archaeon]